MGYGAWSSASYTADRAVYKTQTREELFNETISKDFDPKFVEMRESFDSDDSPESNAIILALDVTGSMGFIAEHIAKESLGVLVEGILETSPVSDPHIMVMGIGDINYDDAPLQVTQFEADNRISAQLVDIWLEGGGGGNSYESYDLAWAFAATKTDIDCFNKRNKKGYLFTIGDEPAPPHSASPETLKRVTGIEVHQKTSTEDFLKKAQERYNVFHVVVDEGYYASTYNDVYSSWEPLLGKRVIRLTNYKHVSEVILSVMRVNEGADPEQVISSWQDRNVQSTVRSALFK